ncbi:MAG: ATP-binding protein [Polaromonas sp.]|nr:ATP-binding protein [Polaromonas sp.]
MWTRFTSHLYVRIWLAVVATVVVLTFLVGAAWRLSTDAPQLPIREVLVYNQSGEVIGTAQTKPGRKLGDGLEFDVVTRDGQALNLVLPRPKRPPGNPWNRPPFGFGWILGLVGLAVALGAYPVMRRLTLRLEALQRGVERWGAGDLSARVDVEGRDEVAFLARRFNHAAERIETLMALHKSLLANASHELRSPLARIRMSLELMNADAASPQWIEISRSISELDQLIDEILLASRLDAKQTDAEPFETLDLTGLAAEECSRVNAQLQAELGIAVSGHSLTVQGSARLLRRLIRNLLENARRYSSGEISLTLAQTGTGAQQRAVIRVNDRGPGVPPDQRERIFEPFYRLRGASEHEGGVGLGLALVKSITERHGGTVRCEARPGGGASFIVELPVADQNA